MNSKETAFFLSWLDAEGMGSQTPEL